MSALTVTARKDMRLTSPLVVKLGGSVIRSPELNAWLAAIASADRPVIVVPGGGALADEVRGYQQSLGFGDGPAHRMALLAMDQLAWAVAGVKPGFDVGESEAALFEILQRGRVAVWAPYALIANRNDLPASWSLTSDSLALWLAGKIGASHCYLIKSIIRKGSQTSAAAAFPRGRGRHGLSRHVARSPCPHVPARTRRSGGVCGLPDGRRRLRHRHRRGLGVQRRATYHS